MQTVFTRTVLCTKTLFTSAYPVLSMVQQPLTVALTLTFRALATQFLRLPDLPGQAPMVYNLTASMHSAKEEVVDG